MEKFNKEMTIDPELYETSCDNIKSLLKVLLYLRQELCTPDNIAVAVALDPIFSTAIANVSALYDGVFQVYKFMDDTMKRMDDDNGQSYEGEEAD